jgi:hypothetical protein
MAQQPLVGQGLLIIEAIEASRSHSVGLLWTSDQLDAVTSTRQHTTLTRHRHPCPRAGFEPAIPASKRPQTHALDGAATGIGIVIYMITFIWHCNFAWWWLFLLKPKHVALKVYKYNSTQLWLTPLTHLLCKTLIVSVLLYGCETRTISKTE